MKVLSKGKFVALFVISMAVGVSPNSAWAKNSADEKYNELAKKYGESDHREGGHTSSTVTRGDGYECERFFTMAEMYGESSDAPAHVRTECTKLSE